MAVNVLSCLSVGLIMVANIQLAILWTISRCWNKFTQFYAVSGLIEERVVKGSV